MTHTRKRLVLACLVGLSAVTATGVLAAPSGGGRSAKIRSYANVWLGTPYLWGGENREGVDCSGYVRQMFRDLFNVELPRTTRDQINLGIDLPVSPSALERTLQPGDLMFFVDREGTPSHVVAFVGAGQITHSESGRGVVIDPLKYLWGRRIVARRVLVPSNRDGSGGFGAIPAAGPIIPIEIPCPPSVVARRAEIAEYASHPVDLKRLGDRTICEHRALASALRGKGSPMGRKNADVLELIAASLEKMDAFQETLGPRR